MFEVKLDRDNVNRLADEFLAQTRNILSYLLLPVSIPLLFLQETMAYMKEVTGINRRSLEGKVVLITGASSGIGESLAKLFYGAGCRLILASRRKDELERVKNGLVRSRTSGVVHVPAVVELDLGSLDSIPAKCKSAVEIYGHVDILVNNAGISNRGTVLDTTMEVHQKIMNINYFGTLSVTREIARGMVERNSGSIVFVSSVQGKIALPFRSAYSASKHAMQALADSIRAELSSSDVNVTIVHPGFVKTNLSINALTGSGERHNQMDASTENGYTPEYVAEQIYKAVRNGTKEVLICGLLPRVAILLRLLCPRVYFFLMAWRAKKIQ